MIASYNVKKIKKENEDELIEEDFHKFISENSRLNLDKTDYICMQTGHTNKIIGSDKLINTLKPVVVFNYLQNCKETVHVKDMEVYNLALKFGTEMIDGTCIFKETNVYNVFILYNRLKRANCCTLFGITGIQWYTIGTKRFLFCEIESNNPE